MPFSILELFEKNKHSTDYNQNTTSRLISATKYKTYPDEVSTIKLKKS
jgi:hypothetical protein